MSRVSVNKDLLDNLADSISNKFDEDTPLTLANMKGIVDDIPSRSSTDLSSSGATVTAPAGYYANNATKTIATGSVTAPSSISATANKSVVSNKLVLSQSVEVTPNVTTPGYISTGTSGRSTITLTSDDIAIKSATNYTPSTSSQKIIPGGTYVTGDQTIMAMPSGTAGTPTATKGTVSNHQVTVTPSVTNTTGYITGGTKTGTGVTVTASELASGNKSITVNGNNIDVVGYSTVSVAVPGVSEFDLEYVPGSSAFTFNTTYDAVRTALASAQTIVQFWMYDENYGGLRLAAGYGEVFQGSQTINGTTFTECIELHLEGNDNEYYSVAWGYSNGSVVQAIRRLALNPTGTLSITQNGTGIDVAAYANVNVAVPSGGGNVFLVTLEFDDETGYWVPNQTLDDIATAYGQGKTIVVNCDEDISFVSAEGKYWNNYGTFEYFVREEKNNSTVVVVQDYTLYQNNTVELNWEDEYGEITDGNEMYFGDNPEITPYVGYGEVDSAVLR